MGGSDAGMSSVLSYRRHGSLVKIARISLENFAVVKDGIESDFGPSWTYQLPVAVYKLFVADRNFIVVFTITYYAFRVDLPQWGRTSF